MKKAMCSVMMGLCLTAIQTTVVQAETLPAASAPVFMQDDELAQEQGAWVYAYVNGKPVFGLKNIINNRKFAGLINSATADAELARVNFFYDIVSSGNSDSRAGCMKGLNKNWIGSKTQGMRYLSFISNFDYCMNL